MLETEAVSSGAERPIAEFRLTRSVAAQWVLVSVAGFFAFAYCFGYVLAAIRGAPLEPIVVPASPPPSGIARLGTALGLLVLVVVPHELLHGVFMARYGGSPSYGVGVSHFVFPYAYAETRGASYTRNQLLVALLAPVTLITAVGLLAMVRYPSPVLVVPLAANAAGSIGDLWMAGVLCQYPADVRIAALPDGDGQDQGQSRGFAVYGSSGPGAAPRRLPGATTLSAVVSGAVGTLAGVTVILVGLVLHSLAFDTGTVVVEPDGWLLLRHELRADGSAAVEIGHRALVAVAIACGVAWSVLDAARRSRSADEP